MGIGEWAGLSAALLWTLSSMIWGKINLSAFQLNLCKNIIGGLLVAIHIAVLSLLTSGELLAVPMASWGWLAISGLVGIVIGDTLYFRSLQILGPRRALMMATSSPIFSAILGACFLKEMLPQLAIFGVLMTVGGVVFVVADRKAAKEAPGLKPGNLGSGIICGMLGAVCQAVGGVFSKLGMCDEQGLEICSAVEATFIRIMFAALVTIAVASFRKQIGDVAKLALNRSMLKLLIPATALGTWLGIWCSQIAYGNSKVAVAQTLLATCPLFAIPIVWLVHKHKVTYYSIIGTMVALTGVALVVSKSAQ